MDWNPSERLFRLIYLLFLLLCACGGPPQSSPPAQPTRSAAQPAPAKGQVKVSFKGNLLGEPYFCDRQAGRFRWERGKKIFLGWVGSQEKAIVLDPESKTFLRYDLQRAERLKKEQGTGIAQLYLAAARGVGVEEALQLAEFPHSDPCQKATTFLGQHGSCEVETDQNGVQRWTHSVSRRGALNTGAKKSTSGMVHEFDVRRGILLSQEGKLGPRNAATGRFSEVEDAEFEPEFFEIPAGYQEDPTDQDLLDSVREPIGWPTMIEGRNFTQKQLRFEAYPAPPHPAQWNVLRERWYEQKKGMKMYGWSVEISTAVPARPRDLSDPKRYRFPGWGFPGTRWDKEAEVGDFSLRNRRHPEEISFAKHGVLFHVEVGPDHFAEKELLPLCERLAEAAKKKIPEADEAR